MLLALLTDPGAVAHGASERVDPALLSLDAAISLALEHSPKLKEARLKVALARIEVRATTWWNWLVPSITAHQGYDLLARQDRAAVALSVDISKFLGKGAREAERANLELAQAEQVLEVARGEVVVEVTRAVFHRDATADAVGVREAALAHALKLQAFHTIRFDQGAGDLVALLQAEAALSRAYLELQAARQEAHLAQLNLLRTIGLPLP